MALSHEQLNAFENLKWARDHEAPLSNRGFIKYKPELKTLRDVPEIEPAEGDFTFLAKGIDSLQECFNIRLNASVIEQFEKAKKQAVEDGHEISLEWNLPFWGDFQMCKGTPKTGGVKYFLLNGKIEILISNTSDIWGVSVRYLSSALWQYGYELMRLQVHTLIKELSCYVPEDYHRLSRVDVCVDFMGKNLNQILKPSILEGVVVPARSRIGEGEGLSYYVKSGTLSTLTIGSKSSLELQIYDKAREISEKSKKEFMFNIWSKSVLELKNNSVRKGIYRFEMRFSAAYLRNRGIRTFDDFLCYEKELESEAMYRRRICVPSATDKNRSRWAYHPLYVFLRRCFCANRFSLPIGRVVVGYRQDLLERGYKQIAGSFRSLSVLKNHGIFNEHDLGKFVKLVWSELFRDKKHLEKIDRARERYKFIDAA